MNICGWEFTPIAWWIGLGPGDKSSWIQAFGSIAAILIPFAILIRQRNHEAAENAKARQHEAEENNRARIHARNAEDARRLLEQAQADREKKWRIDLFIVQHALMISFLTAKASNMYEAIKSVAAQGHCDRNQIKRLRFNEIEEMKEIATGASDLPSEVAHNFLQVIAFGGAHNSIVTASVIVENGDLCVIDRDVLLSLEQIDKGLYELATELKSQFAKLHDEAIPDLSSTTVSTTGAPIGAT